MGDLRVLWLGFGDLAGRAAAELLIAGAAVTGVRRSGGEVPAGVTLRRGDGRDPRLLDELVAGADLVVASYTPDGGDYRSGYLAPAEALAAALERAPPRSRTVLWVSSTRVWGAGDGNWVDEETPPRPADDAATLLLAAEARIRRAPARVAVVRPAGVYGPGRGRLLARVAAGRFTPAEPLVWSNRIHAADLARLLVFLAARCARGEPIAPLWLACDGRPAPIQEVERWLAARLGVPYRPAAGAPGPVLGRRCRSLYLAEARFALRYPDYRAGYAELTAP
ncbi:MAG: NAD(P)-dependent oxidoreductase [Porticoccaceae bacterium]|nr:MAG: NAD(P)-dependent oxidoreductase [Porticoccaceae bacterium]